MQHDPRIRRLFAQEIAHNVRLEMKNRKLKDAMIEARYFIELAAHNGDPRHIGQAWDAIQRGLKI
jgi:hypothetical protein